MLNYRNIIFATIGIILFIALLVIIWKKSTKKRKFNTSARSSREKVQPQYEDEEDDDDEQNTQSHTKTLDLGIARAGDEIFDSWLPIQELMNEIGIQRVINNMVEYNMDDGSRTFVGIALMEQSNPYLQTTIERNIQTSLQQLFLDGLDVRTKISSQHQRTDMSNFFANQRAEINNSNEPYNLKQQGLDILKSAQEEEENINRTTNNIYVQFIVTVDDSEVYGDNTKEIEKAIYHVADDKINQAILKANEALSSRDHALHRLSNYDILELLYKTFNRDTSKQIPFERIIREQKYSLFVTANNSDEEVLRTREFLQTVGKAKVRINNDKHIQELKKQLYESYRQYRNACEQVEENIYQGIQRDKIARLKEESRRAENNN